MAKKSAGAGVEPIKLEDLFLSWRRRLDRLDKEHGTSSNDSWGGSVMKRPDASAFAELLAIGREMDAAYRQAGYPKAGEEGQHQVAFLHELLRLGYAAAQGVNCEGLWKKMRPEQGREMVTLMVSLAKHITKHGLKHEIPQHAQESLMALFLAFPNSGLEKLALELAQQSKNKSILLFVEVALKQFEALMKLPEAMSKGSKQHSEGGTPLQTAEILASYEANKEFFDRIAAKVDSGEELSDEETERAEKIMEDLGWM